MKNMVKIVEDFIAPTDRNDNVPHALSRAAFLAYMMIGLVLMTSSVYYRVSHLASPADILDFKAEDVLRLVNEARLGNNLEPLVHHPALERAALRKAMDMLERDYFSHVTPDDKDPWYFIERENYKYFAAGENLAIDFTKPEDAHNALMNSPSHRANILNPVYKEAGVAVAAGEFKGRTSILIVQMFGTPTENRSSAFAAGDSEGDLALASPTPTQAPKPDPTQTSTPAPTPNVTVTEVPTPPLSNELTGTPAASPTTLAELSPTALPTVSPEQTAAPEVAAGSVQSEDEHVTESDVVQAQTGGSTMRLARQISFRSQVQLLALFIITLLFVPSVLMLVRTGFSHPKAFIRPLIIIAFFIYLAWFGGVLDIRVPSVASAPANIVSVLNVDSQHISCSEKSILSVESRC